MDMAAFCLSVPWKRLFPVVFGSIRLAKLDLKVYWEPKSFSEVLKILSHLLRRSFSFICFQKLLWFLRVPDLLFSFFIVSIWYFLGQSSFSVLIFSKYTQDFFNDRSIEVNKLISVHKESPLHELGHIQLIFEIWVCVVPLPFLNDILLG